MGLKLCQLTTGRSRARHAGLSTRSAKFFGFTAAPVRLWNTRSSGPAPLLIFSSSALAEPLIGISRRLLRVFGVPKLPSDTVSRTRMAPTDMSM